MENPRNFLYTLRERLGLHILTSPKTNDRHRQILPVGKMGPFPVPFTILCSTEPDLGPDSGKSIHVETKTGGAITGWQCLAS